MFEKVTYRWSFWSSTALVLVCAGLYSAYLRFTKGLGETTHLSDSFPWGLWIGFDVLCGVALAAGGFTISAVVYVFNIKRFRPIIRPTILTAFSGYLLVIVALLFDLGRPWRIWHPLVMGNPHSVMFEVAWCVTLYTTVLALEFSPIVFQRLRFYKLFRVAHSLMIPLVMVGVILSTLHQSSLGSLYLIVPEKLHPLWYTPLLPLFFFVSAIALGCAMTIVESFLSYRAFRKRLEIGLLSDLGKVIVVTLGVYLILRVQDLLSRGVWPQVFSPSYEARMFLAEVLLGLIAPIVLLAIPRIRQNHFSLFAASVLVVLGFIMNRLNVSITGMESASHTNYLPSWNEASVTAMIVALGFVLFSFAVKYLPVFPEEELPVGASAATQFLAPVVLRQPWFSSTFLVLVIGGMFLVGSVSLAVSGFRHRVKPVKEVMEAHAATALDFSANFKIPGELVFPQSKESPGPVVFRHSSHTDARKPDCAACHLRRFSILATAAQIQPGDMHSEIYCGSCHNGNTSFSVKEDCAICHQQ